MAHLGASLLRIASPLVLTLLVILAAGGNPPAYAANISVNTTDDELNGDGDCSLREAITAANTDAAVDACAPGIRTDTINLPAGTYTLSIVGTGEDAAANGDLDITDSLTIIGGGAGSTIIDGNGALTGERVIQVDPLRDGIRIEMSSVAIQNGNDYNGGGIDIVGAATATLTNVTISGNTADWGGGIDNRGTATLTNVTISGNTAGELGGGIRVGGSGGSGVVTLTDSTISGNTAQGGGGMLNWNTATLTNVTVSDNQADDTTGDWSGGMDNWGTATLTNVTISGNTGWGFMNHDAAVLANTIVANNSAGDCAGSFTSGGHNLIENVGFCTITGDTTGNITGADPKLGPLAGNGGPTLTHALLADSPAIDAGDPAGCDDPDGSPLTMDQRGMPRHVDGDENGTSICDMGAFEYCPSDMDCDGFPDSVDACPTTPTVWATPIGDSDCDGFTDADEGVIGTDASDNCSDDLTDDAWPSDFDMNTVINITDVFYVLPPHFGSSPPNPDYSTRRDLAPDGTINITDVFMVLPPYFGSSCTP